MALTMVADGRESRMLGGMELAQLVENRPRNHTQNQQHQQAGAQEGEGRGGGSGHPGKST